MRRALHIGIFIGTLLGAAACGTAPEGGQDSGWYGTVDVGRSSK